MSKKIYIAGKMTGLPEYNYPKFFEKENELLGYGWTTVNPAQIARDFIGEACEFSELTTDILNRLIRLELEVLATCDSIYLIKGWETSVGTKKELQVALALGLEVICE